MPLRCVWHPADSEAVVVVVHGLGGSADSVYMHRAVEACARAGVHKGMTESSPLGRVTREEFIETSKTPEGRSATFRSKN